MGWFTDWLLGGVEQRSIEDPKYSLSESPEELLRLLGIAEAQNALPIVSIEAALGVPAVFSIVAFLSRTLAALPLPTFEAGENGARVDDPVAQLLSYAPNDGETSYGWRRWHWQQVFTGGRGLAWIERIGRRPVAIWPMDPALTTIRRVNGERIYTHNGRDYRAGDVIDTPFMLKRDGLGSYSPIAKINKAISLAIAMESFAGGFFLGGGVPPLALEGPLPSGADAYRRAQNDIQRAIDLAKKSNSNIFGMPPGHNLKPVGIDPSKGQMVEARAFQIIEISRGWQMPPVFVQDLSKGTFSNTEQQDLWLAKHLIMQWAKAFEDELTLKLYGWQNPTRRVRHNLDGLQRGAFKERSEALARAIQTGQLTPNEARALEQRAPMDGGDQLYVQQATVPLVMAGAGVDHNGGSSIDDNEEDAADASTQN
ncbi:phage portal protein [Blastomonas sp. CCH5-A3]|jgi:HK97 family phage portal protein|uniref:phage portal protein n=1 Tax=Blastomonas sp. CCH5-A3 TaxID=1768761 RepID=UPI0008269256|nr:phage portal protein [Blastomonas sp. CCH5-A3]MAF60213.1 phage portal protein [Blastomonas sp.]|tara:strand:+ start:117697 stop:118971 length:1275 start_codon:yes stop_codon:yes gene_type:complete